MSVLNHSLLLGADAGAGYQISRSLRFNSADSAYLSRTPSVAGNRKTWTWSGWVKRSKLGAGYITLFSNLNASNTDGLHFNFNSDNLQAYDYGTGAELSIITSAVFRDPSAWYHVVLAFDTTQATASNRARFYVNGVQQTASGTYPSLNADGLCNSAQIHAIGRQGGINANYFDGYLADIHFIDGQALTPSSFGEFDANGEWQPKAYSGTYGTNGFKLDFADNSAATAAALGKDTSGNGNNFTPTNFSVAAGAGNDSLVDTPTSYGTDTGAGGEVRGNYCTWNPLAKLGDITQTLNVSNGNLTFSGSSNIGTIGTIGMSSGKWYWELNCTSLTASQLYFGMTSVTTGSRTASFVGIRDTGVLSGSANGATTNGSGTTAFATGDVVGFAYDADSKRLFVAKNNTWLNGSDPAAGTNASFTDVQGASLYPFISDNNTTATIDANFGQRPFAYTAPSGFKALCDTNLPTPVVAKPSAAIDVRLYTGNGSTNIISGLSMSPDLLWIKTRGLGYNHRIFDSVRTASNALFPNLTGAENSSTEQNLVSFDATGFTLGVGTGGANTDGCNQTNATYVAWCWDAGSSTVTNTAGTISSQVRANPSAGFSILTYTGAGAGTIGHGLGAVPGFIIVKKRNQADEWTVYHSSLGASNYLWLHATNASQSNTNRFGGVAPTSTVFSVGGSTAVSTSGHTFVAYCWAPVSGYSAFGSYNGNGAADGPYVYLGFRPAIVFIKMSSSTSNWTILDDRRAGYNVDNDPLYPNLANAEATTDLIDITSNGFKVRSADASINTNAGTYVYAAWAEFPFQYARAR